MKGPSESPRVSVIVPTLNEAANVRPLVGELRAQLSDSDFEVVFADDSTDATTNIIRELAATDRRIKLYRRDHRTGLASAVTEALGQASGKFVVVMDGDLQHPPKFIPRMLDQVDGGQGEMVVASRYARGGGDAGLSGPFRRMGSKIGRLAAYALLPEARRTTDPLSGFFLFKREITEGVELRPLGFKILLEILVRCRPRRVLDAPFDFQRRTRDESKASTAEVMNYLKHLLRLRR